MIDMINNPYAVMAWPEITFDTAIFKEYELVYSIQLGFVYFVKLGRNNFKTKESNIKQPKNNTPRSTSKLYT